MTSQVDVKLRAGFVKNTRFVFFSLLLVALDFTVDSPPQKASKLPRYGKQSVLFTVTTDIKATSKKMKQKCDIGGLISNQIDHNKFSIF